MITPGSIHHGSHLLKDLIPAFISELEYQKVKTPYKGTSNLCKLSSSFGDDHAYWDSETARHERLYGVADSFCYNDANGHWTLD